MRIQINAEERELALFALELADKECESTRKGLERLREEHFGVMALQGGVDALRRSLKETKRHVYDWGFDDRRLLAVALHLYREQLSKLAARETKLIVQTSITDERITDVRDFISRLAGQETLFTDVEHAVPSAGAGDTAPPESQGAQLTPRLIALVEQDVGLLDDVAIEWLEEVAGLLDRGGNRLAESAFTTIVRAALPRAARVVPDFDGTMQGGYLLEEVLYDDINAQVLAAWLRAQHAAATAPEPPVRLSSDQINEIRTSLGKDPLEDAPEEVAEAAILAEHQARNPFDYACAHCGVAAGIPCKSASGKIVASLPHAPRMKAAEMESTSAQSEIANRLYTDAVLWQVFGRVDDELRSAAVRRRSIDLGARWVQTAIERGGAHASAS